MREVEIRSGDGARTRNPAFDIICLSMKCMIKCARRLGVSVAVAVFLVGCRCGGCGEDALSLWRDGAPAKSRLVRFVAEASNESSIGYIPPAERIAVFDFDGTLFCETAPTYFDWMLFEHRVLEDASYCATPEQKAAAMSARASGVWPPLSAQRERMMAQAWRGMTPDELAGYVRKFMGGEQRGFAGMKRCEAFYKPMLEVVKFLEDNGWTVYVCSGTDRFVMRPVVEDVLGLPPWRIIGSDPTIVARSQGADGALDFVFPADDEAVFGGESIVKNLQMNKVSAILREIGVRPSLAFGNSMSDASMLDFVLHDTKARPAAAFMLLCDDTVREYGDDKKSAKMRRACAERGWIPVSMRDDWKTIYGDGVRRTAQP